MAETIADALNFSLSRSGTAESQLLDFLRGKEMLLVLDNMEHVLAGVGFLAQILNQAPNVKLLVTSRERLQLHEEWLLALQGLSFPTASLENGQTFAAIDLFVQCARRVVPGFVITRDEQTAVAQICHLVEGLPLGIELAASWLRLLSCQEIAAEVERSFSFLSTPIHNVPPRHRNLQAVFAHSWKLLTPNEQQTLSRLSLFRGGFSRDAAEKVAGANLLTLASLVDKSFVRLEVEPLRRYNIHNMLGQFARKKLAANPTAVAQAQRQYCHYFASFLQERLRPLQGGGQVKALQEIRVEIKNVRAALAWILNHRATGDELKHLGMIALDTLFLYYNVRSWFQEGYAVFDYAVEWVSRKQISQEDAILLGWVLARKGWFAFLLDRREEGQRILNDGLTLLRKAGARQEMIFCLNYLGAIAYYQNDLEQARQLLDESLTLSGATGDVYGEAIGLNVQGVVAQALQEYETAAQFLQASLTLKKRLGDLWGMAFSLNNLGNVAAVLGRPDEAQRLYYESLEIRREMGDKRGVAICLRDLGQLASLADDSVAAQQFYAESALILAEIGDLSEADEIRSRR